MRASWDENERVRQRVLEVLEQGGPQPFWSIMEGIGCGGKSSGSAEGRRLDRALQYHKRARTVEFVKVTREWRLVGDER